MRLSEERIDSIAQKIAFHIVKKRIVRTTHNLRQMSAWVEKPILDHLSREDGIDDEVTRYIEGLEKKPPQGSFEYQAMFQKKKEEVAARRGFEI